MGFAGGKSKSKSKDEDDEELVVVPPDGGWGWVVVFGSFMIHVIADGISYSFGVVIKELLIEFDEGKGPTSWIVSILIGVTLASGPLASSITNRFGCRLTTMVGGVIATIGTFLSYFGGSVLFLMITMGFITGIGFGLMYCPAIIIVTVYFEKRRALATGIAVAGAGVGTLIFPPFTAYLMSEYTWRGTFFIYAGIIANCIVCGALFRPPPTQRVSRLKSSLKNGDLHAEISDYHAAHVSGQILDAIAEDEEEMEKQMQKGMDIQSAPETRNGSPRKPPALDRTPEIVISSADDIRLSSAARQALVDRQTSVPESAHSHSRIPTDHQSTEDGDRERFFSSELISNGRQRLKPNVPPNHLGGVPAHSWSVMPQISVRSVVGAISNANAAASLRRRGTSECHHAAFSNAGPTAVLNRKDIFYRGSVTQLPEYKSNPQLYRSQTSLHRPPSITHDHAPDYHDLPAAGRMSVDSGLTSQPPASSFKDMWRDFVVSLKLIVDWKILTDPLFLIFAISNFLTSVGMTAPLVFLPPKAADMGIHDEDLILSIYGAFNTVGRIIIGFVSDKPWANRLLIYNVSLSIGGVGTMLSFLCSSFGTLSFYSGFYGVALSAYISLTSVILVDLVGLDSLTNAFGLMLLFQGVASLIGAPIAGTIADMTGNYDGSFHFAGAVIMVSGLMLFPLPCVQRWLQRRDERKSKKQYTEMPLIRSSVEA